MCDNYRDQSDMINHRKRKILKEGQTDRKLDRQMDKQADKQTET